MAASAALVMLCSCGLFEDGEEPAGPEGIEGDRPSVILVAASGHPLAVTTATHDAYLIERGTAGVLAGELEALGHSVWIWDHADEFFSHDAAGNILTPWDNAAFTSFGFLHLLEDLAWIRDNWVQGVEVPTRVIVLGHSHGVVWAHLALLLLPDVPVDILIDLDGDSTGWGSDPIEGLPADGWDQVIVDWSSLNQVDWAFDISQAADAWTIDGVEGLLDVEDLVPASVSLNLEVQSAGLFLRDSDPNFRLDGSQEGIETLVTFDGHDEVASPNSEAVLWAAERVGAFYSD